MFAVDRLNDGARLFTDSQPGSESWSIRAAVSQENKPITLSPGAHHIRLDYSQNTGLGSLRCAGASRDLGAKGLAPSSAD